MNKLIIIILIFALIAINYNYINEKFDNYYFFNYLPWWNTTRNTRNMSYDLRGDPLIIQPQQFVWNNSNLF